MTAHAQLQVAIMSRQLTIFQCSSQSSASSQLQPSIHFDDSVSDDIFDMDDDNCDDVSLSTVHDLQADNLGKLNSSFLKVAIP